MNASNICEETGQAANENDRDESDPKVRGIHDRLSNAEKTDTIVPTEALASGIRLAHSAAQALKHSSMRSWSARAARAGSQSHTQHGKRDAREYGLTQSLEMLVEIPALSVLLGSATMPYVTAEQVAVSVQKLDYQPDAADVWNLPSEQPTIAGALDLEGTVPVMRCTLPLPEPGEVALYRVAILKTGASLDAEGKSRAQQLLPTEEELLLFVVGAAEGEGQRGTPEADQRLIPGIQRVIVPLPTL
jgi:hypothetical protein